MLSDLPLEKRLHVQGLLADLDSKMDERGLITIVPGGLLFAMNSEAVQEGAHDTLAKVAELISVYDDRKVLIVGHTDAVGDAAYNKQLSERRAELVKQFFVDNFEVEEDRLSTQGFGEARPIASDATPQGSARQSPRGGSDPELTWRRPWRLPAFSSGFLARSRPRRCYEPSASGVLPSAAPDRGGLVLTASLLSVFKH